APLRVEFMTPRAARNFGASASVRRPMSPYLSAPPLACSTTSLMGRFVAVATRRAMVKNSLRSWWKPVLAAEPFLAVELLSWLLPASGAGRGVPGLVEAVPLVAGLLLPSEGV